MEEIISVDYKQYVVFIISNEEYGIDIHKVATIEKMMPITRVPRTPAFLTGVINLRGEIVPVMDLRKKFNLTEMEETEDTRIIILKIGDISVGIIVDSVVEVIHLAEESVENTSNFSSDLSLDYILGVGKINDRIVTLLNLEKLIKLSENE